MANYYKIELRQNQTFTLEVLYKDSSGAAITSISSAQMQIKERKSDTSANALLTLNSSGSGLVVSASLGKVTITITDEQTAALTAGSAMYDLLVELSDGTKHALIEGDLDIEQGVTTWQ